MSEQPTPAPGGEELYPGHAADHARQERRAAAIAAANREILPGPLLDAFASVPEEIAGLRVRPLVHYDFVLLRKLESPLLRQADSQSKTPFGDEEGYEMVLQFTRSVKEAAALVARGREHFRQQALEQIGMRLGPVEVGLLVKAVEREFLRAFSTVIQYSPTSDGNTGGTVFTPPPADPTTASAGGSTTPAG
jgi:hypothetical protein